MFAVDSKVKIINAVETFKHLVGKVVLAGTMSKTEPETRQMVKLDGGGGLYFDTKDLEAA